MLTINHEFLLNKGRYRDLNVNPQCREIALDFYRFMLRLRRTQLALIAEYHPADEMRCPVHFCVGQEAVPAALSRIVSSGDFVLSHHRSHGYYFAKGGKMNELFAEIYGKVTGTNGGRAGSQEISKSELKFYSGAIISGMIAIAVGVSFSNNYLKNKNITFTCHGDGATEEGAFWEAISYAALGGLPVIFICENNRYATYSPQYKRQARDDIHQRVAAFGVKSVAVFGNDVLAVHGVLESAVKHVNNGSGPVFIEAYTYRWNGHVGPEDDDYIGYRPLKEKEVWMKNCPISLLEEELFTKTYLDESQKQSMIKEIDQEIDDAFRFAKESEFPEVPHEWDSLNYSQESPLADRLLMDGTAGEIFNGNQSETKLKPY